MSFKGFLSVALRVIIPLVVLLMAVAIAVLLVLTKPEAKRGRPPEMETLVEFITVSSTSTQAVVEATGTVIPARSVDLQAQVGGVIIWKSPELVPGSTIAAGTELIRIDPRDYEYAVQQQKAQAEQAAVELQLEKARKAVAEEEWKLLEDDIESNEAGRTLALREPQMRAAEASEAAAASMLKTAELNLERTIIKAPFNSVVIDEFVDEGQLVSSATRLASLAGADAYWVKVSLPVADLSRIQLPDEKGNHGSSVTVAQDVGDDFITRIGTVIRLYRDVESAGRMARILASIPAPLEGDALLLNSYVDVRIDGKAAEEVLPIPLAALREGGKVWVINAENRLDIRPVDIGWKYGKQAFITGGLEAGERVVTSRIPVPIPGMRLNFLGKKPDQGQQAEMASE